MRVNIRVGDAKIYSEGPPDSSSSSRGEGGGGETRREKRRRRKGWEKFKAIFVNEKKNLIFLS